MYFNESMNKIMCTLFLIVTIAIVTTKAAQPIDTQNVAAPKINIKDQKPEVFWNSRPFNERNRKHLEKTLKLAQPLDENKESLDQKILNKLGEIYNNAIKPLEEAYKFRDISNFTITEGDIFSLPKITFIGPWSTGKSSMINYLLNVENLSHSLPSGATPTTTDFTVMKYDKEFKSLDGMVLAIDSSYAPLKQFGHSFLEKLHGLKFPSELLQKVTIIDTPGIIENHKQRERGYPFNDVCQWFLAHSEMIVVVFDPTKLDVGMELEKLFKQLKGHESKVRFVLNKADALTAQELMRVYGALFWNLAPLINVTEPPRLYVGSFWSRSYNPESAENHNFFLKEEISLLQDLHEEIANWVENKIVALRQHALYVRNHALMVDQFLSTLQAHDSIFQKTVEVANKIAQEPNDYQILQTILAKNEVSIHDVLPLSSYTKFFSVYEMNSFLPVGSHCRFFGSCYIDLINAAINQELPNLLFQFEAMRGNLRSKDGKCDAKSEQCKP